MQHLHIHTGKFRHIVIAVGVFLLVTFVGLWSWNTLSDLFNIPHAQYRHAVAATVLLLITGWMLRGPHKHHHSDHKR